MKLIEKRRAMTAFYYLMAVDGAVTNDELSKFQKIAKDVDPDSFSEYESDLIEECEKQLKLADAEDEYYDIVQEGMDKALLYTSSDTANGISARLLLWDLLAVAFSNNEYSDVERRLIGHVVRTIGIEKSIFLEMEELIKTATAIEKERIWITTTDKPYGEVRPIVEELEKRQQTVLESAKALIEDEVVADEIYEVRPDFIDKTKAYVSDKMSPIAAKIGEKVNPIAADVGEKTKKVFGSAKEKNRRSNSFHRRKSRETV